MIVGDAPAFYALMVDRDVDAVSIEGDVEARSEPCSTRSRPHPRKSGTAGR